MYSKEEFRQVDGQQDRGESAETSSFIETSFYQKILEFEALVKEFESNPQRTLHEGDDPVIIWTKYIDFMASLVPRNEDAVYRTRKRATRALIHIEKYANDVRFLRICILAADSSPRPLEDFQGLYNLGIGLKMACFWMVWAFKAESVKEYLTATAIYMMAIKHKAVPVDIVRERYSAYKKKMRELGVDYDPREKKKIRSSSKFNGGNFQTNLSDSYKSCHSSDSDGSKRRRVTVSPIPGSLIDISNYAHVASHSCLSSGKYDRPLRLNFFHQHSPSFEMIRAKRKSYKILQGCMSNFNDLTNTETSRICGIPYNNIHKADVDHALECLSNGTYSKEYISSSKIFLRDDLLSIPTKTTKSLKKNNKEIIIHGVHYIIVRVLGKGHYGTVLLLESKDNAKIALKIQKPASCLCWEYFILERLQKRLALHQFNPFPQPISFTLFQDGASLAMSLGSETGFTLLDVVNVYKGNVPELLVIYYTHQLFRILQVLHIQCQILVSDRMSKNRF